VLSSLVLKKRTFPDLSLSTSRSRGQGHVRKAWVVVPRKGLVVSEMKNGLKKKRRRKRRVKKRFRFGVMLASVDCEDEGDMKIEDFTDSLGELWAESCQEIMSRKNKMREKQLDLGQE